MDTVCLSFKNIMKISFKKNIDNFSKGIENTKVASDYKDPDWVEINVLMPEILQAYREQYAEMVDEGYTGTFTDYLKNEISLKRKKFANGSSFMNNYLQQSQFINQPKKIPEARGLAYLNNLISII